MLSAPLRTPIVVLISVSPSSVLLAVFLVPLLVLVAAASRRAK